MKELMAALFKAQQALKDVKKDKFNKHQNYWYTSVEGMVEAARNALQEYGLLFIPSKQSVFLVGDDVFIQQEFVLYHIESDQQKYLVRSIIVPNSDRQGACQLYGTAESYLLKNVLRELLLVPRYEEKEDADSNDQKTAPTYRRTAGNPSRRFQ